MGGTDKLGRIAVTWKKSTIGFSRDQRRTIAGLGLRRLHQTVEHEDVPSIMGMVHKVRHLVEVKELASAEPPEPKAARSRKKKQEQE